MAKKIKWTGPIGNPGAPVYTGPLLCARPNGASRSNEPTCNVPTHDDAFLVTLLAMRLGLPNGLMYWELAVSFAKELEKLEANKKKNPGAPATWRTGAVAIQLVGEIQALMKVPNATKAQVIRWIHGDKPYRQIKFETFRVGCHEVIRKYGKLHKP